MTYTQFLAIFLIIPLIVAAILLRRQIRPRLLVLLGVLSLVALVYTAPWDNLIVVNGVWSYHASQIAGIVLGHVPLEEYVFYVLQVFLTGLVAAAIVLRRER